MLTIAVFPNMNKPEAPEVLQRILSFYADKDVRVIMPVEEARFFQHAATASPTSRMCPQTSR